MPGRSCGARSEASTIWRALSWSALKVWANSSCERRFSARNWMSSTISVWMPRNFCRKRSMRRASRAAIISFTKFSAVRHTTAPSGRAWARPVATAESRWGLPSPQPPQRKSEWKRAQRRDPRIVVLVEQLAAQPAPRFDPDDDVRHPRPLFDPDPCRAPEDPPRNALHRLGKSRPTPPTHALTRLRPPPEDTTPPHRRPVLRKTAASNPSPRCIVWNGENEKGS